MSLCLYGYRYSVYAWIARLALREKGVDHEWVEIDPFADDLPPDYLRLHPFKRVPALVHDGFSIYETCAITRYVDEGFRGPNLQPTDARRRARCNQIISIIDSYAYWPLIRQAYAHRVFRKLIGGAYDDAEAEKGLIAAPTVLGALETIAADTVFLCGPEPSLADIHLAPMIGYFAEVPEGACILQGFAKLSAWWSVMSSRMAYQETAPGPPMPSQAHSATDH